MSPTETHPWSRPRRHPPGFRSVVLVLLVGLVVFASCSSERWGDEPQPQGGSDSFGHGAARAEGLSMLTLVNDLILLLPAWAQGRFEGVGASHGPVTATWNADDKAWAFSDSLVLGSTHATFYVRDSYGYGVRYYRSRTAQREAATATAFEFDVALQRSGHGESDPDVIEEFSYDYAYRYWARGDVSGLPELPFDLHGYGSMEGQYYVRSLAGVRQYDYAATYEVRISLQESGHPAGTVTIEVDPYTMTGTYDGSETVAWTLRRGTDVVSSGTRAIDGDGD